MAKAAWRNFEGSTDVRDHSLPLPSAFAKKIFSAKPPLRVIE